MSELEHIGKILSRVLRELDQTWREQKEGKGVETVNQESLAEANKI